MNNKRKFVYLVGSADVESSSISFVCVGKQRAKRRFEEVRKKLLKHYEDTRQAEKYRKSFPDHYEILKNITFENIDAPEMYTVHETPYWRRIMLDQ